MMPETHGHKGAKTRSHQEKREFYLYLWGFIIALALTLVPFAVVHGDVMARVQALILIGCFALVQMGVHFRFFLHIGIRQKREDFLLVLFSALLLFMMVAGTIWVMLSLASRMNLTGHM